MTIVMTHTRKRTSVQETASVVGRSIAIDSELFVRRVFFANALKRFFYLAALPFRRGIVESMTVIPLVPNVTYRRKVACIFRLSFNICQRKRSPRNMYKDA